MKKILLAIFVAMIFVLTGCYIPEKFTARVDVHKDGSYTMTYDGTMVDVRARKSHLSPKDHQDLEKEAIEIGKDPEVKYIKYIGHEKYRISMEVNRQVGQKGYLFSERDKIIQVIPLKDEVLQIYVVNMKKNISDLKSLGLKVDGKLIVSVPKGMQVLGSNADRTPSLFGLFGDYEWDINSFDKKIDIRLRPEGTTSTNPSAKKPSTKNRKANSTSSSEPRVTIDIAEYNLDSRSGVLSFAFSPDGAKIVSVILCEAIKLWDTQSGKLLNSFKDYKYEGFTIAFSPDGSTIALGSIDNTIKLWDAQSGKLLNTLKGHKDNVYSVSFSPDGTKIASGSRDDTIKLWDVQSGKLINTLKGHKVYIHSVSFSPNGTTIASAGDNTIKLWDAQSGRLLNTLIGNKFRISSIAFSPDSTTIASGGNKTIKLWDVQSGKLLNTLKGHKRSVNSIAFSPDGTTIASGSWDQTVKLWDAQSGKLLTTLKRHINTIKEDIWNPILSVAFSPDGSMLASGSFDNTISLWDMSLHIKPLANKDYKSTERKGSSPKPVSGKDSINSNSNTIIREQKYQKQVRSNKVNNNQTANSERQELEQLRAEKANSERQELEQLRAEKAKAAQEKQDTVNLENENISLSVRYKKSENKVSFTVHTVNKYANAKGGASISFPDIKEKGKIHKISKSGFDSIDIYPSGKKIWNGKLKKQIVSGYSLVEGWSKKWEKGRDNRLVFEVDTRGLKQLRVNIRALLLKNKNEKRLPIDGREDQQGYPAKQLVIELSNRKINDSSKEFDSVLADETLCSSSDDVVLSCNIKQKILSVCHQKDNKFVYKYGKPHKVELTISSRPLYSHNQFIRMNVESRLRFHNKGYDYIVYSNDLFTYDKHPNDGTGVYKSGHGIYVVKNNKLLATLKCNKTYPYMEDIYRFRDSFRHEKYSFLDGR